MKLTVKNLGPISQAEVDLSKDLIILTGENNTGKTYVAYGIYGIIKRIKEGHTSFDFLSKDQIEILEKEGKINGKIRFIS